MRRCCCWIVGSIGSGIVVSILPGLSYFHRLAQGIGGLKMRVDSQGVVESTAYNDAKCTASLCRFVLCDMRDKKLRINTHSTINC